MNFQTLIDLVTGMGLILSITVIILIKVYPVQTAIKIISFILDLFGWRIRKCR